MRLDIKTVKKRKYVQVVDDLGYIYHVGPANPKNLAAALYIIGYEENSKWSNWLNDYYCLEKGNQDDETINNEINAILNSYDDGADFRVPRSTTLFKGEEIKQITDKLFDKFDYLHEKHKIILEAYTASNPGKKVSKTRLRKLIQKTYRTD